MAGELASKPASEATYRELVAAMVLQGVVTGDGGVSPQAHADYAVKVADELIASLERAS